MNISKSTLISLAVGIFVIMVAGLGVVYFGQGQEQSRLNEELSLAQLNMLKLEGYPAQLQQLVSQHKELENKLTQTESQINTAKASLDQSLGSIEASGALFEIADTSNVEVTEISSPGINTTTLEGITLSSIRLIVTAEGEVFDLIDFVYNWTKQYPTGVVQSVEMTIPKTIAGELEPEVEEEEKMPSVIVNILIYSYTEDK